MIKTWSDLDNIYRGFLHDGVEILVQARLCVLLYSAVQVLIPLRLWEPYSTNAFSYNKSMSILLSLYFNGNELCDFQVF